MRNEANGLGKVDDRRLSGLYGGAGRLEMTIIECAQIWEREPDTTFERNDFVYKDNTSVRMFIFFEQGKIGCRYYQPGSPVVTDHPLSLVDLQSDWSIRLVPKC